MTTDLSTLMAAFVVGLATSLHCTVMCGPLVCALRVPPLQYHLSRLISYTVVGALCGLVGQGVTRFIRSDMAHVVPWAFAAVLLLIGLGLDKRIPQPRFLSAWLIRLKLNRSLGLLTPLIPCGPLWLVFATAALSGSWWMGATHMVAFTVGTIPLPWLLQTQAARLQKRFTPATLRRTQQSIAIISAAIIAWRTISPHACCH